MAWLSSVLLVVQVLCALAVIVLVLIQQGKGAEMGAAFGSSGGGASGSLFGATGSANFLSRATAIAATLFFTATLGLAYLGNSAAKSSQLPKSVPPAAVPNPAANSVPTVTPQAAPSPAVPTVPAGEKTK
ncbi:MAG: preprotein translocase subunit SecG [Betaproteobacteria bacterium]|nr:preprotein translocase subunit SecG [Betaproteobacteria bacterium]